MGAGLGTELLVLAHDVSAGKCDNELLPLWTTTTRDVADLRTVQIERRRLGHLPPNDLIQIVLAGRHLLESYDRHFHGEIWDKQSNALRSPEPLDHPVHRSGHRPLVAHIVLCQGRNKRRLRQRLDDVGCNSWLAASHIQCSPGHLMRSDFYRDRRRPGALRRERKDTHSTKVTLLISRSVVVPSNTRSTADSRRKRIPSSRAAFLIS